MPSWTSRILRLLPALAFVPFLAPAAMASHPIDEHYHGAANDCDVVVDVGLVCRAVLSHHDLYSVPTAGWCSGTYPSYTSCDVRITCEYRVEGTLTQGTLNCGGVGGHACTVPVGATSCGGTLSGIVTLTPGPGGNCYLMTVTATTGTATASVGHWWCIYMNGYGPYI